jgi:hypothetical protein
MWFGIYAAIYLGFLIGFVVVLASDSAKSSLETRVWLTVGWSVIGLLVLFVTARFATAGVFVGETGIRVRNPLQTPHLMWDDIERFELRRVSAFFPCVCIVVLRDGSEFRAIGIRASNGRVYNDRAPAQHLVDELNGALRRARPTAP